MAVPAAVTSALKPLQGFAVTGLAIGVIAAVHNAAAVAAPSCRNTPASDLTAQQFARCITGNPSLECKNEDATNVSISTCCHANLETAGWQATLGPTCGGPLGPAPCNRRVRELCTDSTPCTSTCSTHGGMSTCFVVPRSPLPTCPAKACVCFARDLLPLTVQSRLLRESTHRLRPDIWDNANTFLWVIVVALIIGDAVAQWIRSAGTVVVSAMRPNERIPSIRSGRSGETKPCSTRRAWYVLCFFMRCQCCFGASVKRSGRNYAATDDPRRWVIGRSIALAVLTNGMTLVLTLVVSEASLYWNFEGDFDSRSTGSSWSLIGIAEFSILVLAMALYRFWVLCSVRLLSPAEAARTKWTQQWTTDTSRYGTNLIRTVAKESSKAWLTAFGTDIDWWGPAYLNAKLPASATLDETSEEQCMAFLATLAVAYAGRDPDVSRLFEIVSGDAVESMGLTSHLLRGRRGKWRNIWLNHALLVHTVTVAEACYELKRSVGNQPDSGGAGAGGAASAGGAAVNLGDASDPGGDASAAATASPASSPT